jgi:hypothetical protein
MSSAEPWFKTRQTSCSKNYVNLQQWCLDDFTLSKFISSLGILSLEGDDDVGRGENPKKTDFKLVIACDLMTEHLFGRAPLRKGPH